VQSLQPISWLAANGVAVGGSIDMAAVLDMEDLGALDGMSGRVESIGAIPQIEGGDGRVVLTTVNHLNSYVFDLKVADGTGEVDSIGITGYHKVFSEERGWVNAAELQIGEDLRSSDGRKLEVVDLDRALGTYRVYNLTVESDHVFYVGDLTTLVHNNRTCFQQMVATRSIEDTAAMRRQFDNGGRADFLQQFAATPGAQGAFTPTQLSRMSDGFVPEGFIVHHKQPLFRGGDNSFDNLLLVDKQWHVKNSDALHNYTPGNNPFGRN
jgi:hypothetical protein